MSVPVGDGKPFLAYVLVVGSSLLVSAIDPQPPNVSWSWQAVSLRPHGSLPSRVLIEAGSPLLMLSCIFPRRGKVLGSQERENTFIEGLLLAVLLLIQR